jgi:hypothetical protein
MVDTCPLQLPRLTAQRITTISFSSVSAIVFDDFEPSYTQTKTKPKASPLGCAEKKNENFPQNAEVDNPDYHSE